MMFNRKVNFAALLMLLIAVCREAIASCSDGQYLNDNSTCVNCTVCAPYAILEECSETNDTVCSLVPACGDLQYFTNGQCNNCTVCENAVESRCTNTSNTVCSRCREFERPNAGGGCEFDCDQCQPNGVCEGHQCRCDSRYEGVTCDILRPLPDTPTTPTVRTTDAPEEDGNRVVLIVCIVAASVFALAVLATMVVVYWTCSRRTRPDSENSDDSTYSSASINSRTMLTNSDHGSNGSLQHSRQSISNGYRSTTILPPPTSWNKSLASAIK